MAWGFCWMNNAGRKRVAVEQIIIHPSCCCVFGHCNFQGNCNTSESTTESVALGLHRVLQQNRTS